MVGRSRFEVAHAVRQRHVALDGEKLPRLRQPVTHLAQILADDTADLVRVGDDVVEAAVLGEPLRSGLRSDFLDAGDVVDTVADQREVVRDTLRRHAELRLHAGRVEGLVRHRVYERDVRAHELRHVLVAGGDDGADALALGLPRQRADDVVRFDAIDDQERPPQRADAVHERLDLRGEIVGHRRAVRLVVGVHFVAEGLAFCVENAGAILRREVLAQAPQHVDDAVDGSRGLARLVAQVGQRVKGTVQVGRAVHQQERGHRPRFPFPSALVTAGVRLA